MKGCALFLLILTITFFLFLGYSLLPASSLPPGGVLAFQTEPLPDDDQLKVITYNIGYASGEKNNEEPVTQQEVETNLKNMVLSLLPMNADIISLQEVDFRSSRTYDIDQLEYLAEELHLPYAAYVVTWNKRYVPWPYWPPSRHFGRIVSGQAILSRHPITEQTLLRFEKPKANAFWYNWFYLERITQRIQVEIEGKKATIWNIHLETFKEDSKREQTEILAREVVNHPSDIVLVTGDFNSPSEFQEKSFSSSEQMKLQMQKRNISTFTATTQLHNAEKETPLYSSQSWKPTKKIDHIFFNDALKLEEVGNLKLTASDHLPIWASFSFTP